MHQVLLRLRLLLAFTLAACGSSATVAATLVEADEAAIRRVIATQLQALADDDADAAFATATPEVRAAIGEPGRFLAMVRGAYPMVFRPGAVLFLKPEEDAGTVTQMVSITDTLEKTWLAVFAVERQPDASWRIRGCSVFENGWRPV
jgi:Domain of unknown function (DUF4864)